MLRRKPACSHLMSLGFTINVRKSVLIPTQNITFIGLCLNSVTFKACLSAERVEAFQACLALFCRGTMLKFKTCLRLLGLMVSALVVVPLGHLHMRPVQRWVASLKLNTDAPLAIAKCLSSWHTSWRCALESVRPCGRSHWTYPGKESPFDGCLSSRLGGPYTNNKWHVEFTGCVTGAEKCSSLSEGNMF